MIDRCLAALFGLATAALTYLGFQHVWEERPMLWALPVIFAVLSLGFMVHDEEMRSRRNRSRREQLAHEKIRDVTRQQVHGGAPDE